MQVIYSFFRILKWLEKIKAKNENIDAIIE